MQQRNTSTWAIIFCAECRKPFPPGQLTNYNGNFLCDSCDCEEVLSSPPEKHQSITRQV